MSEEEKTFKVICAHAECQKPFHVRFPLTRPNAAGTGEVVVTCLYCSKNVMITIPTVYIQEESLVRGLKSLPPNNPQLEWGNGVPIKRDDQATQQCLGVARP